MHYETRLLSPWTMRRLLGLTALIVMAILLASLVLFGLLYLWFGVASINVEASNVLTRTIPVITNTPQP